MQNNYFYSHEAEQFTFYRIPKLLFTNDQYKSMSTDAKVLYGLLLDRVSLSTKNNWVDTQGRVFIIYTREEAQEFLNIGKDKSIKLFKELVHNDLLEEVRQGLTKPNILYVKNFVNAPLNPVKSRTSEKQTSGNPKNRLQDVRKTDPNYTDINYTDIELNNNNTKPEQKTEPEPLKDVVVATNNLESAPKPESKMNIGDIERIKAILEESIRDKDAKILWKAADGDIEKIKEKYAIAKDYTRPIKNLIGFLVAALIKDFKKVIGMDNNKKNTSKNKFCNYEQRDDYDWDELERKEFEYMINFGKQKE